jgi:5'-nucleotidase (lipoprotein e(P4) family)
MRRATCVLLAAALAGCASSRGAAPPRASEARPASLPGALVWVRRSAEYRALTLQTYAVAARRLDDTVPALTGRAWGVILDADETVLDNSEYQRRRAVLDSAYSDASWAAWVEEASAPAVPGAVGYASRVHALGGRVVIVTNRAEALCAPTRANLRRLGIAPDLVLCQPPGEADKNPRFSRVQDGTASPELPPLRVVEWVGDNIQDFPHLTQAARADSTAFTIFGRTYFVLPNPMYGSWQGNETP